MCNTFVVAAMYDLANVAVSFHNAQAQEIRSCFSNKDIAANFLPMNITVTNSYVRRYDTFLTRNFMHITLPIMHIDLYYEFMQNSIPTFLFVFIIHNVFYLEYWFISEIFQNKFYEFYEFYEFPEKNNTNCTCLSIIIVQTLGSY